MTNNLYHLFQNDPHIQTPHTELEARIFDCIKTAQAKKIRNQKIIWISVSCIFSFVVILTGIRAVTSIASSNVNDYLSLVFSDTASAFTVWKELSISIIESLPIIGIGLFLASIYLLFWSAKKYTINSKILAY
ncbi:MAG: hypothetical protein WCO65_02450 [bacterium]